MTTRQILFCILLSCFITHLSHAQEWLISDESIQARHEADAIAVGSSLYLLGGRGIRATDVGGEQASVWQSNEKAALDNIHHFQTVLHSDSLYIASALTGNWPNESPLENLLRFDLKTQEWSRGAAIPHNRQRGAAGAVVYKGRIYVIGGITNGHMNGSVAWFDEFDPNTGKWRKLPDAPRARDHFQAAVVANKLYLLGGRTTSHATGEGFTLTIPEVDVFDFNTQQWSTLPPKLNLRVPRAGTMTTSFGNYVIVAGGESGIQASAHNEVDAFNVLSQQWQSLPNLNRGRHGGGMALIDDDLFIISGSGNRGGEPELVSLEKLAIAKVLEQQIMPLYRPIALPISGPMLSESSEVNPFTDYLMLADFVHSSSGKHYRIRGFFNADGRAAASTADTGTQWQANFMPQLAGEWRYSLTLWRGEDAAWQQEPNNLSLINAKNGQFSVSNDASRNRGFYQSGMLEIKNAYFWQASRDSYWLKNGVNSPENFLAHEDIDGTYRSSAQNRNGEASSGQNLHQYKAHINDWQNGDPSWREGRGKGIIGAINYLAKQGMNAQYFLTMNINGDGRDVWPYVDHNTFDRFDVSKLAQWDRIFTHMQSQGILLHIVTQETENERLLDDGNTGKLRQLYYLELIARFAHHPALVWNLGEENGPAEWSPIAQDHVQRLAMADFFAEHDPYKHPIVIHSHADQHGQDSVLRPLLGSSYNGVSLQVDDRTRVYDDIMKWRTLSKVNKPWLITMDEIGMWHTGAKTDAEDPGHDSLRKYVLWPAIMAGAAGIEWYSGAKQAHNDLSTEDFRVRQNLWRLSTYATALVAEKVPFGKMNQYKHKCTQNENCAYAKYNKDYALIFLHPKASISLDRSFSDAAAQIFAAAPNIEVDQTALQLAREDGLQIANLSDEHELVVILSNKEK